MPATRMDTDRPLVDPAQDALGRRDFARHLAGTLIDVAGKEPLVVALYGPWGSGKTSILNMVELYLRDQVAGGSVALVRFNPWYFQGDAALLDRFLRALAAGIGGVDKATGVQVAEALYKYARWLKPLGTAAASAAGLFAAGPP